MGSQRPRPCLPAAPSKSAAPLPLPAVPPDVGSSRPSETGAPSRETFARIAVLAEAVAQDLRQLR